MSEGGAPSRLGRDVSLPLMSGSEWGAKRGAFPPPPPPGLKTRQRAESAAALARGPSSCGSAIDGGAGGSAPSLGVGGSSGELRPPPMGARMGSFERNQGNVGRARSATTATCGARDGSAPDVVKPGRARAARAWMDAAAPRISREPQVARRGGVVVERGGGRRVARRGGSVDRAAAGGGPLGSPPGTRSADEIAPPPPPPAAKRALGAGSPPVEGLQGPMAQPLADGTPSCRGGAMQRAPSSRRRPRARARAERVGIAAGGAGGRARAQEFGPTVFASSRDRRREIPSPRRARRGRRRPKATTRRSRRSSRRCSWRTIARRRRARARRGTGRRCGRRGCTA